MQEWSLEHYASALENKTVHVNFNNLCYKYYNKNGHILREHVENLKCSHEETDR